MLPDAHLSARRDAPSDGAKIRCGPAAKAARRPTTVGSNYAANDKRPWLAEFLSSGQSTIGVFAIKTFPYSGDPLGADFDAAIRGLLKSDAIIIDLCGNEGGDDSRAYQLAKALLDGPVSTGAVRAHHRQTPETFTRWLNALDGYGRQEDGSLAPNLREMYAATEKQRDDAVIGKAAEYQVFEESPFAPKPGPNAFKGPIAILVDESCASSCESGMEVLRLHPNAKVLGRRTGGFVDFGNVGGLWLPSSGVRLGIPTRYNEYLGGKFYDKVGFEPHFLLNEGSNAFDQAAAWIFGQLPTSKPVAAKDYVLPESMRQAEIMRLTEWGIALREGEVPLAKAYAPPFTRRSYVVPQSWFLGRVPKLVFAPALVADLEVLGPAMDRAYGGWAIAEKHGWSWSKWFEEWRTTLASHDEKWVPIKEAFEPIRRFQQFQLDNHTTIPMGLRFGAGSQSTMLARSPTQSCTHVRNESGTEFALNLKDAGQAPKQARYFDGKKVEQSTYIAFPANRGSIKAVKCGGEWIDAALAEGADPETRKVSLKALSGD